MISRHPYMSMARAAGRGQLEGPSCRGAWPVGQGRVGHRNYIHHSLVPLPSLTRSRLIMSPWNLVASLFLTTTASELLCGLSTLSPKDLGLKDFICFPDSGKGPSTPPHSVALTVSSGRTLRSQGWDRHLVRQGISNQQCKWLFFFFSPLGLASDSNAWETTRSGWSLPWARSP